MLLSWFVSKHEGLNFHIYSTAILIKHHFVRTHLAFNLRVENDDIVSLIRFKMVTKGLIDFLVSFLTNLTIYIEVNKLLHSYFVSVSNFFANCTILDKYFLLLLDFDNIPALIENNHLGD